MKGIKINIVTVLLITIVTLVSCKPKKVQEINYIPLIRCNDVLCKAALYDIKISEFNMKFLVQEKIRRHTEKGLIEFCFTIDSESGGQMYYSLKELIDTDSNRFALLTEKYSFKNEQTFFESVARETLPATLASIDSVYADVYRVCDCK